jgi:hypothetical protein
LGPARTSGDVCFCAALRGIADIKRASIAASPFVNEVMKRCGALQRRLLIIFQYWFARRSVEMGVRPRKTGRTRWGVVAYFACVHALQRRYRRDCNDHAKSDGK